MNWRPRARLCSAVRLKLTRATFGGKRKGKRGRGAAGKIPVFGLLKRGVESLYQDYPRCFRRHADPHHRAQGGAGSASFIPTAGAAIMYWMCQTSITSVSPF